MLMFEFMLFATRCLRVRRSLPVLPLIVVLLMHSLGITWMEKPGLCRVLGKLVSEVVLSRVE